MENEFINYTQALALKELGFDEPCFGYYRDYGTNKFYSGFVHLMPERFRCTTAPLYQQAFRFLREKHGLYTDIFVDDNKTFGFMVTHFTSEGRVDSPVKYNHITYEEAEQACLDKLIEIIKNK
jgi:hypothetical protein